MNAIRSWEADFARRLGIGGLIEFDRTTVGKTLHVPCAVGEHLVDVTVKPNMDPNGTVKVMLNHGWTLGRRRLVCPDCKRKNEQAKADRKRAAAPAAKPKPFFGIAEPTLEQRKELSRKANAVLTPEQRRENGRKGGLKAAENRRRALIQQSLEATPDDEIMRLHEAMRVVQSHPSIPEQETKIMPEARAVPSPAPTPTDKARAAKRDAMDLLTLAFKLAPDGKSGTYSDGYSDARIAKETGLAEHAVATLREDFFGPLGQPNELVALRAEFAAAKNSFEALKAAMNEGATRILALDQRLTIIAQRNGWPLT